MAASRWCVAVLLLASLAAAEIQEKGWWKNAVFYQIYPRSFMDSNNDGIGDLNGITSKLQHFKDSGITAIWLSPIYASPMVDFGYDISDFRQIDPAYGTMADFEKLTATAKKLGIKVVMDLVPNHTSDKHEWFKATMNGTEKYKDYYVWKTGKNDNEPPNNWLSVFSGSAWTYETGRNEYYFHQFDYRQPDLNYANDAVKEEMEDIIKFWLDKGIDGFRIDAVPHLFEDEKLRDEPLSGDKTATERDYNYLSHIYTKDDPRTYELVKSWRAVLDKYASEKNSSEKVILTEAYTDIVNTTKFYDYGSHVPFNFNFIMQISKDSTPKDFKNVIDEWMKRVPQNMSANWVMGNHDRTRLATRFPQRADQMTMLAMILPGIAVTYNGEEIGMEDLPDITWEQTQDPQGCNAGEEHYKSRSRDPVRTPFQWDSTANAGFSNATKTWLPVHPNYKEINLADQKTEPNSHYKLYTKLTALRNGSETLKNGKLTVDILNNGEVLAVARTLEKESIVLLINFRNYKSQVVNVSNYTTKGFKPKVVTSSVGSNMEWDSTVSLESVKLPGGASLVLSINGAAFLAVPIKLILGMALFALIKQMF